MAYSYTTTTYVPERKQLQALQLVQEDRPFHDGDSALQRLLLDLPVPCVVAQPGDRSQMVDPLDPKIVQYRGDVQQGRVTGRQDDFDRGR